MRETRIVAHQATGGAQTPWHETNPSDAALHLPAQRRPRAGSGGGRDAAQFDGADRAASTLKAPIGPRCGATTFPTTRPISPLSATPRRPSCRRASKNSCNCCAAQSAMPGRPAAAAPDDHRRSGLSGRIPAQAATTRPIALPLAPPPMLVCPPGFADRRTDAARLRAARSAADAPLPAGLRRLRRAALLRARRPPIVCPPDFRPLIRDDRFACGHRGPPPPFCPSGSHPAWNGFAWACGGNPPPPPPCLDARPLWSNGHWGCVTPPPPRCPQGQFPHWSNGAETCSVVLRPLGPRCPQGYVPSAGFCAPPTIVLTKRPPPPGPSPWHCLPGTPGCGPIGPNPPALGKPPGGPGLIVHEHRVAPGGPPRRPCSGRCRILFRNRTSLRSGRDGRPVAAPANRAAAERGA